jgi:hypothetical protein
VLLSACELGSTDASGGEGPDRDGTVGFDRNDRNDRTDRCDRPDGQRDLVQAEEPVTFTSTVSGDEMSGTYDAGTCLPPNAGTWEAVRSP